MVAAGQPLLSLTLPFKDDAADLAATVKRLRDELHRELMDKSWKG